jgi:hypothetical protein
LAKGGHFLAGWSLSHASTLLKAKLGSSRQNRELSPVETVFLRLDLAAFMLFQ